jgi:hypothetical protein
MFWVIGIVHAIDEKCVVVTRQKVMVDTLGLLNCIIEVDKALKEAVIGLGVLDTPAFRRLAHILPIAYAECKWLDIGNASDVKLDYLLEKADVPTCVVTCNRPPPNPPLFDPKALIGAEPFDGWASAAAWVQRVGVTQYIRKFPSSLVWFTLFTEKAEPLLHGDKSDDIHVGRLEELMCIADFCVNFFPGGFRYGVHQTDVAKGILLKLAAHIARRVTRRVTSAPMVLPRYKPSVLQSFSTTIPWVAAAYYQLLSAVKSIEGLVLSFDADHIRQLAALRDPQKPTLFGEMDTSTMHILEDPTMKLSLEQRRAFQFLCETPDVAALNILFAFITSKSDLPGGLGVYSGTYLFGFYDQYGVKGFCINPPKRGGNFRPYSVEPPRREEGIVESTLAKNIEHLHQFMRDYRPSGRRRVDWPDDSNTDDSNTDDFGDRLKIECNASQAADLCYRVDALVEWMDFMHERCEQFDYAHRSGAYVAQRLMMPLSSKPVTQAHADRLVEYAQGWESPEPDKYSEFIKTYGLRKGRPFVKHDPTKAGAFYSACVVLAVVRGDALSILQTTEKEQIANPPWSTTHFGVHELVEGRFIKDNSEFVFEASGYLMGTVHNRLVDANCQFDHWRELDAHAHGAKIVVGDALVVFQTRGPFDSDKVDITIGDRKCVLDIETTHWWDRTYGAVVLPVIIDTTQQKALLVVPGGVNHPRDSPFVSAGRVLQWKDGKLEAVLRHFTNQPPFLVALDPASMPSGMPMQLPSPPSPQSPQSPQSQQSPPTAVRKEHCGCKVVETDNRIDTWIDTEKLACIFIAYAYAGSICGTRLMPFLAARAHAEDGRVVGMSIIEALRMVMGSARCPMGFYAYSALFLVEVDPIALKRQMRCSRDFRLHYELTAKVRACASGKTGDYWVRYDARELLRQNAGRRLTPPPGDEWRVALEARTGAVVRDAQNQTIHSLLKRRWCVAQMHMGFGKSSVVVPLLVAAYLQRPAIRAVFVTQPDHLKTAATRILGAFVASHPVVADKTHSGEDETLVYVLGADDFRRMFARVVLVDRPFDLHYKLVVVLSTSEMQCLVRDFPGHFYNNHSAMAHIADEVDSESDPLTCEVVIQGQEKQKHPNPHVARNIEVYYDAVYSLVQSKGVRSQALDDKRTALNEMSQRPPTGGSARPCPHEGRRRAVPTIRATRPSTKARAVSPLRGGLAAEYRGGEVVPVGDRLWAVYQNLRNLKRKVDFGMAGEDDPSTLIAVPYAYADVPSKNRYVDIEVASILTARAVSESGARMRESDRLLLERELNAKIGGYDERRGELPEDVKREYFATVLAMPQLQVSKSERMVSFTDLLGASGTFVGISGTMGTSLHVPRYVEESDPRRHCPSIIDVLDDADRTEQIKEKMRNSETYGVQGQYGEKRSQDAIEKIGQVVQAMKRGVTRMGPNLVSCICIVDACGELGLLPDAKHAIETTLSESNIGYFDQNGTLKNPDSCVRYYSHRDSRGVDSKMPVGTVGFTIVAFETTTFNDAAQAMYRMRRIDDGAHEPRFVVFHNNATEVSGDELVVRLVENETTHTKAAQSYQQTHLDHTARRKAVKADFDRKVEYMPVDSNSMLLGTAQHEQEKTKENQVVRHVEVHREQPCYHSKSAFPKCMSYDIANRPPNHAFLQALESVGIWMSGFFRCYRWLDMTKTPELTRRMNTELSRRAFGIYDGTNGDDGARTHRPTLLVMSIVEVFVKNLPTPYSNDNVDPAECRLYTHDGKPINQLARDTDGDDDDDVLRLGRFMCNDRMSIDDEVKLLCYLDRQHGTDEQDLLDVFACLYQSRFLSSETVLLSRIDQSHSPSEILQELHSFVQGSGHSPLPDVFDKSVVMRDLTTRIIRSSIQ